MNTRLRTITVNTIFPIFKRRLYTPGSLGSAFNSFPDRKVSADVANLGLFGIPELKTEDGFQELKDKCVVATSHLIEEATSSNRTRHMVDIFDELSDSLCQVADLAEFIRMAHPDPAYAAAAEDASMTVQCLVETLNTNRELYSVLNEVVCVGDKQATTETQDHICGLFLFDFEQSGIHLPENERNKVVNLNYTISQLGQLFVSKSNNPRLIKKHIVPHNLRHLFRAEGDSLVATSLQADSSNSAVREMAYRIFLLPDAEQEHVLMELLKARFELAQTCGFPTYAHRALNGSTMEQPEAVMDFLNVLNDQLQTFAQNDYHVMHRMNNDKKVAIWDVLYLTLTAKKTLYKVENSEFSPYFSLGSCMEGLNFLFEQLYGISLKPEFIQPGECWSDAIYKLAVVHESEGPLGYIYCDFYERSGKHNQDCHFTIRGGKRLEDGTYQLPIVVLMLNLSPPRWNSPTLLSPYAVDYLFHEMGHAMHSMLARTTYQHVSGTRCATDFAEVPSVLMEYFARDKRVLKTFARHFQTKESIPEDMLNRLCASKNLFMASEMHLQVFYSALDQIYHSSCSLGKSTTDILAEVQSKYYSMPYVPNTAWQLRFSHLVSYGAKYYSYLVSRALASWIWQTYFEADPINREQGEWYRRGCLQHGGGKPPRVLVKDFLQRQPTASVLADTLIKEINEEQSDIKMKL